MEHPELMGNPDYPVDQDLVVIEEQMVFLELMVTLVVQV